MVALAIAVAAPTKTTFRAGARSALILIVQAIPIFIIHRGYRLFF
jgi:hypothetical protein